MSDATTTGWRLWVPAAWVPVACLLFDLATGGRATRLIPVTLMALTATGIASLVIARNRRDVAPGLAVVGPMWIVTGLTLAFGAAIAAFVGLGALLSVLAVSFDPSRRGDDLAGVILGLAPLWTGIAYLKETRALTEKLIARFDRRRVGIAALIGVLLTFAAAFGTLVLDSWLMRWS